MIRTLRRYAATCGPHALEVGPGSGVYLPVLSELFAAVVAIDTEQSYLQSVTPLLKTLSNVSLQRDDIQCSTLPSGSFDLVLCSEVIEHISDSRRALGEMHRLLRAHGVLVLTTPQRYSLLEACSKFALLPGVIDMVGQIYQEPVLETGHINLLTVSAARRQLIEAGFVIEEAFKSGLYLPLAAEFLGTAGMRLEQWLERRVAGSLLEWLLWTQYYVARKV